MVFAEFENNIPTEEELILELDTNDKIGTHPNKMVEVAKKHGYEILTGVDGDLNDLNALIDQGYVICLAISVDVPHFVIYLGHNNNHAFFHDPWYGPNTAKTLTKFLSPNQRYPFYRWRVKSDEFKKYHPEFNFDEVQSNRGWFAFKKKVNDSLCTQMCT